MSGEIVVFRVPECIHTVAFWQTVAVLLMQRAQTRAAISCVTIPVAELNSTYELVVHNDPAHDALLIVVSGFQSLPTVEAAASERPN